MADFAGTQCGFDTLNRHTRPHKKKNYLETISNATRGTDLEIYQRINMTYNNCGVFRPITNNCEILSNYVRYGRRVTLQVCGRLNSILLLCLLIKP